MQGSTCISIFNTVWIQYLKKPSKIFHPVDTATEKVCSCAGRVLWGIELTFYTQATEPQAPLWSLLLKWPWYGYILLQTICYFWHGDNLDKTQFFHLTKCGGHYIHILIQVYTHDDNVNDIFVTFKKYLRKHHLAPRQVKLIINVTGIKSRDSQSTNYLPVFKYDLKFLR